MRFALCRPLMYFGWSQVYQFTTELHIEVEIQFEINVFDKNLMCLFQILQNSVPNYQQSSIESDNGWL